MADLTAQWLSPEFFQNPHPYYAALRSEAPVYWSDKLKMWLATSYPATMEALRDHKRFSNAGRVEVEISQLSEEDRESVGTLPDELAVGLIHSDPPDHTRMRRIVGKTFTPRVIEALRSKTEARVERLIASLMKKKKFDFIEEFAFPLPILVISDLFGVPAEDANRIKAWSEDISDLGSLNAPLGELAARALKATRELKDYFLKILDERKKEPRDDLLTLLIQAEDEGDRLDRSELIGMAILILVAGHETTTSLLSNGLLLLLRHPDQMQELRQDSSLVPSAIEEILRMEPSFLRTPRRVAADMEFEGVQLKKDQMISAMNAAANRDPEVFEQPDLFNIHRSPNKHLAFGHGPHHCLGAPLARLEASIAFPALLSAFPNLQLADETVCFKHDFSNRRLDGLNLVAN